MFGGEKFTILTLMSRSVKVELPHLLLDIYNSQIYACNPKDPAEKDLTYKASAKVFFVYHYEILN